MKLRRTLLSTQNCNFYTAFRQTYTWSTVEWGQIWRSVLLIEQIGAIGVHDSCAVVVDDANMCRGDVDFGYEPIGED